MRPARLDTHYNMSPVTSDRFESALCRTVDPDLFFPEPTQTHMAEQAKSVCAKCPHFIECRMYAIRNRIEYGIWGGQTEQERRQFLKDVA